MKKDKGAGDTIGSRWLSVRHGMKLTQAQLAEKLEISGPYLSLIESDKRPCPGMAVVKRMATLSKKNLEYLIGIA